MEISEFAQEGLDIQWFALDVAGSIASFWSGGAQLPLSVASHLEANRSLVDFFSRLVDNTAIGQNNGNSHLLFATVPNFGQTLEEIAA